MLCQAMFCLQYLRLLRRQSDPLTGTRPRLRREVSLLDTAHKMSVFWANRAVCLLHGRARSAIIKKRGKRLTAALFNR